MDKKAHLAGLSFATIFGFSFMFSKSALAYVSPIGLVAYRFLLAFLGFELLRIVKLIRIRIQKGHVRALLLVAFFQPLLYFLFETFGLALTSSGEAGMMVALIPIFVVVFGAVFLKEKPRPIQVLFIVLSVSGIIFIQAAGETQVRSTGSLGFILLLLAVASAALFNIASRKASHTSPPHEVTYFMMLVGAVSFNAIYLVQLLVEGRLSDYTSSLGHMELLIPLVYLGLIASIAGFFLVNFTLGRLPAHVSSIYANLSTIVAIAAGAIFLHEELKLFHFLGSTMILIGVYGTVWFGRHPFASKVHGLPACGNNQHKKTGA